MSENIKYIIDDQEKSDGYICEICNKRLNIIDVMTINGAVVCRKCYDFQVRY